MNLFNLFATLTLDNSDYEKKLDQSQKSAGSFSSKAGTAFKTGVRAVAGFVAGVTAAATAIGALVVKFVDAGSEIDDNSQKLGISTEAYQYWSLVLQRAGSDASNLSMMIRNMTTFTQELSEGNADALLTLQKLGIGYEDFMAMNTEEQLYAIVEALQGMEDQTDKVQIAQEIFGTRTYQELLPLLNMEQGSLEALKNEFEGLGLILEDNTIKNVAAVGDKLDNLKNVFKAAGLMIASDFLPEINAVLDAFIGLIDGSADVEDAMNTIADSLVNAIQKVLNSAPDIIDAAGNLLTSLVTGLTEKLSDQSFIQDLTNSIIAFLAKVAEILPTLVNNLGDIAEAIINGILKADWKTLLTTLINSLVQIIIDFPSIVTNILTAIYEAFFSKEGVNEMLKLGEDLVNNILVGVSIALGNTFIGKLLRKILGLPDVGMIIRVDDSSNNVETDNQNNENSGGGYYGNGGSSWAEGGMITRYARGGFLGKYTKGTLYALAGEAGAEIVAHGPRGTGVANIEQIADAQYMALNDYDLRGAIQQAAVAVVNGIVSGLGNNTQSGGNTPVIVRIGDKDFNGYIVNTVNGTLRAQGRKSLNRVTSYGKG